jgi:hypothetical protein
MNEISLATVLSHPLGQFVVTVIVAAVTSVLTVRLMGAPGGNRSDIRNDNRAAPPAMAALASPAPRAAIVPAPSVDAAAASVQPVDGAIVAAISAAVYAVMGAHRIVFIADTRTGSSWTNELRSQHHTSHAPHAHASHH